MEPRLQPDQCHYCVFNFIRNCCINDNDSTPSVYGARTTSGDVGNILPLINCTYRQRGVLVVGGQLTGRAPDTQ